MSILDFLFDGHPWYLRWRAIRRLSRPRSPALQLLPEENRETIRTFFVLNKKDKIRLKNVDDCQACLDKMMNFTEEQRNRLRSISDSKLLNEK